MSVARATSKCYLIAGVSLAMLQLDCGAAAREVQPVAASVALAEDSSYLLDRSEEHYSRGELRQAELLLKSIHVEDEAHAYALKLLELIREERDAIYEYWHTRAEQQLGKGRVGQAYLYFNQARALLLDVQDQRYVAVKERIDELDAGLDQASAEISTLLSQAQTLLESGEPDKALELFRGAASAHRALVTTQEDMQLLELRYLASYRMARERDEPKAQARATRRKRRGTRRARLRKEAAAALATEEAVEAAMLEMSEPTTEIAPRGAARERRRDRGGEQEHASTSEALKAAEAREAKEDFYEAIVLYQEVLRDEPDNSAARAALVRLAPRREALIESYHETAGRYFIRQQLEKAVPWFRKILVLEPANARALQGLQMYENLQRIKQESQP